MDMRKTAKTVIRIHRFDGTVRIDAAISVTGGISAAVRTTGHLSERQNGGGRSVPAHSFDRLPGLGYALPFGKSRRVAPEKYVYFFTKIFHIVYDITSTEKSKDGERVF